MAEQKYVEESWLALCKVMDPKTKKLEWAQCEDPKEKVECWVRLKMTMTIKADQGKKGSCTMKKKENGKADGANAEAVSAPLNGDALQQLLIAGFARIANQP